MNLARCVALEQCAQKPDLLHSNESNSPFSVPKYMLEGVQAIADLRYLAALSLGTRTRSPALSHRLRRLSVTVLKPYAMVD